MLNVQNATDHLYSCEGVTQGDPVSMLMYSLAVMPLIKTLRSVSDVTQNWYADDAAAVGNLEDLAQWLGSLIQEGAAYGYFPEPQKSYLIVAPQFEERAKQLFGHRLGVNVVSGQRFLGGFIGNPTEKELFVKKKVANWSAHVEKLARVAASQPQAAFAALTKSLQSEWTYCQRVIPVCEDIFIPLENALRDVFLPAVIGYEVTDQDRILFSLPGRSGGLGIRDPTQTAAMAHSTSKTSTKVVSDAIKQRAQYNVLDHRTQMQQTNSENKKKQKVKDAATLVQILAECDLTRKRAIQRIVDEKTSSWLTVLPVVTNQFDLSATEFRDALSVRYHRPLLKAPATCDGCGQHFDITHALKCKKGGVIIRRHNEVRDALCDLSALLWTNIRKEPVVREADDANNISALVADMGVRGVWEAQRETLFDIRVTDTDALSYGNQQVRSVLDQAENQKRRKYATACEQRRVAFTPFVTSVDGALGREARSFINRLSYGLSLKWGRSYSETTGWVRTRLSFAILRATSQCLRGCRSKWRTLGAEDGAFMKMALD
jgi:hypothetical protein